ncbi:MAG: phytanoyl-CoA dioxygenase [Hellea sp.]|nr:phytanoyl-CoA dioxygenase [Hellea sp.]
MTQDISKSIDACAAFYGEDADAVRAYMTDGQKRALELPNRGPIKFTEDGELDPAIRQAYSDYGFYVFTNVLSDEELSDLRRDMDKMRGQFPAKPGGKEARDGSGPALGFGHKGLNLLWSKPLADPFGGTPLANGRHHVKLFEPDAGDDAPEAAPFLLVGSLQYSESCLRLYAHPQLLKVVESINGKDFAPFNEVLFIKDPFLGAAVSWHQDGDTHWEADNFDEDIHGFNFMGQLYGSTAVNGVWVVPGTHKLGRMDIKKMVAEAGSERLPDAVPIVSNPGDVVINNRQIVHGSFANTGFETRVSANFGFHKRSSVQDVKGAGIHAQAVVYTDDYIKERSAVIGYGINARKQRFPDETPYDYAPLAGEMDDYKFTPEVMDAIKEYNLKDLSI